jgi:hypothetical protein
LTYFISPVQATLDYGCGIGRNSVLFKSKYVGMDMTKELLDIAKFKNPDKEFSYISTPYIPETFIGEWVEQFFTATVLQHCDDGLVGKIFKSFYDSKPINIRQIVLYENSSKFIKPHVIGRQPIEYANFIELAGFNIIDLKFKHIMIKYENHAVLVARVSI